MIPFNDPLNPFYDTFSIQRRHLSIPQWFSTYKSDEVNDPTCTLVIAASPESGAAVWTLNGRWITIGVYQDVGRPPTQTNWSTEEWTRSGTVMTITNTDDLYFEDGDLIDVMDSVPPPGDPPADGSAPELTAAQVTVDGNNLLVTVPDTGATSGYCQIRFSAYDWAKKNCVFRLLPNFKLLPHDELLEIFNDTTPLSHAVIDPFSTVIIQKIPSLRGVLKPQHGKLPIGRRFDQVYDHEGKPLSMQYNFQGQPIINDTKVGAHQNTILLSTSLVTDEDDDLTADSHPYIFDVYGLELNDPTRSPYTSSNIIYRDITKTMYVDNILRAEDEGEVIFTGALYDVYGNKIVGIKPDNTLVIRANPMPINVDRFNRPTVTQLIVA